MKKRKFERISARIRAIFYCDSTLYPGIVTNLSENGIYFESENRLPFKSNFKILHSLKSKAELLIPFKDKTLEVPVKVRRLIKTNVYYNGMGIEVLDPTKEYLEFVRSSSNTLYEHKDNENLNIQDIVN